MAEVVGRERELLAVEAFLESTASRSTVLAIAGESGIGKTTVWTQAVARARGRGSIVLVARPAESEARLSFAGLVDMLSAVPAGVVAALPAPQRTALGVVSLRTSARRAPDRRLVGTALLSVLRGLTDEAEVAVAVDDLHWLDAPTRTALEFALRRVAAERVRAIFSLRSSETELSLLPGLVRDRRVERLELGPLSVASLHRVLVQELGRSFSRPTLVQIARTSGGNPLYALEIARLLDRRDKHIGATGLPVPEGLGALVTARVHLLPERTRNALLHVAASARPKLGLVGADVLAPAEEAGLVHIRGDDRVEFVHPLFASAVYASASLSRRRNAHRTLAEVAEDAEERARHLALAASCPDAEVACALDAAARLAGARGAPEQAAELVELALRLAPDGDPARPERLLAAAGFQFGAGALDRAQTLLAESVAATPTGPLRAQGLRLLGLMHARRSGFAEAVELALAARDAAADEAALRAEIELDLAVYHAWSDDYAGGDAHARAAVPYAQATDDDGLLANALAVQTVLAFLRGRGVAATDLRRALALEDPLREAPLLVHPRFVQGLILLCTGRLDEALATLDALRAETLEQGRESDAPILFLYLVWACVWCGDLERAARFAEEARQAAALLDDRLVDALALSASALASAFAGEPDQARGDATAAIEQFERLQWWVGTIWPRWALGLLELSLGNPGRAHETLEPLTGLITTLGPTDVSLSLFLPDEIEALVELGRSEKAESLLEPFERQAHKLERGWAVAAAARCRALIAAARGNVEEAVAALEDALAEHGSQAMPLERARTLLALGRLQRRRKQKRLARLALENALAVFDACGASLWAEQTRGELARVATRRAASGLTATEQRIARLAADGLTNRAIAEQAFVSVKTVEANLKRAYRKLGISSRAQLDRALDEQGAEIIS